MYDKIHYKKKKKVRILREQSVIGGVHEREFGFLVIFIALGEAVTWIIHPVINH